MCSAWQTVIWERSNKSGKWCPYSAEVSLLLEHSYNKNLSTVILGDADPFLKPYVVNLKTFVQVSKSTGTECTVRRRLFEDGAAVSSQVMWQWLSDGHAWHSYRAKVVNLIEDAYKTGVQETVDLSDAGFHYIIDFSKMMQRNKFSNYHRPIRRVDVTEMVNGVSGVYQGQDDECETAAMGMEVCNPASSPKKKKKALSKQMSSLWKKITKTAGMPDEVTKDSEDVDQTTDYGFTDTQNLNDHQFAIVRKKPWMYPWPPHTHHSDIKPVPGICSSSDSSKRRRKKGGSAEAPSDIDVFSEFTEEVTLSQGSSDEQVCIICCEDLSDGSSYDDDSTVVKLKLCSHVFHKSCVRAMHESGPKDHLQCPTCKAIHGVKYGIQPPGTMVFHVLPYSLPGFSDCNTIQIIYDIRHGVQGPEHPNPGARYSARGFPRHCYLPENEMGRKVLQLLVKAWERQLIFTVGSSSTTGEENTVTWNEIHHKTEFGCNKYGHGFPDPLYFENVIAELAAHGVT